MAHRPDGAPAIRVHGDGIRCGAVEHENQDIKSRRKQRRHAGGPAHGLVGLSQPEAQIILGKGLSRRPAIGEDQIHRHAAGGLIDPDRRVFGVSFQGRQVGDAVALIERQLCALVIQKVPQADLIRRRPFPGADHIVDPEMRAFLAWNLQVAVQMRQEAGHRSRLPLNGLRLCRNGGDQNQGDRCQARTQHYSPASSAAAAGLRNSSVMRSLSPIASNAARSKPS